MTKPTHLTLQDVQNLRHLIDMGFTQKAPQRCDSVMFDWIARESRDLVDVFHGAELDGIKGPAIAPHAFLDKEQLASVQKGIEEQYRTGERDKDQQQE